MKIIDVKEIKNIEDKKNIIDVREPYEYNEIHIEGVKNIPMNGLMIAPENHLNKDEEYIIVCQSGGRSMMVCTNLEQQGYKVINAEGGVLRYFN